MNLDVYLFLADSLQFIYFQNQIEMDWKSKTLMTEQSTDLVKEIRTSIKKKLVM